jgi:hypothetical protein
MAEGGQLARETADVELDGAYAARPVDLATGSDVVLA